ncbi:hypothetical protein B0H94_104189 [Salsuginibacillus halophilus]|uniref:Tic20 family protein n=1 Tax=Salsuginibacillus halophilus TaxID=517424 RepID=A0A2P8HQU2_9BACI|nr:DUF4870 domain-containing protein [Salsuginibacillus halophilus]PSL48588.1 hypothetical protein B0H94_104189 [Salsuginibacillus halophilus]
MSTQQQPAENDRTMAMLIHLLGIFTWFIGPLIIWLIKRDDSSFVDFHGKEAMNLHISIAIYNIIAGILTVILIGFFFMWIIGLYAFIILIIACIRAYSGEHFRIPLVIPFFRH